MARKYPGSVLEVAANKPNASTAYQLSGVAAASGRIAFADSPILQDGVELTIRAEKVDSHRIPSGVWNIERCTYTAGILSRGEFLEGSDDALIDWGVEDTFPLLSPVIHGGDFFSVVEKVKRAISRYAVLDTGLQVMATPPVQYCLAPNAQPGNGGGVIPSFAYTGLPNPSAGSAFLLTNYVWFGLQSANTNNSRGVLQNYATVYNFENWSEIAGTANFNDGQHLASFIASTAAIGALNGTGTATSCAPIIPFITDSKIVAFAALYGDPFTLIVDGKIARVSPGYSAGSSAASAQVCLINFGSRKPRQIIYIGSNNGIFGGIAIDSTASLAPLDIESDRFTWGAAGTSYEQSHPFLEGLNSHVEKAMWLLGAYAGVSSYIGGTGYLAGNTAGATPALVNLADSRRITQITCNDPDVILLPGIALNDIDNTQPWIDAVHAVFSGIRAACPEGIIIPTGPWCPIESNASGNTKFTRMNVSLLAEIRKIKGPWVFIDNLNGITYNSSGWSKNDGLGPWQTGAGKLGTTTGFGNGDNYVVADGTHPSLTLSTRLNNSGSKTFTAGSSTTVTVTSTTGFPATGNLDVGGITGSYTGVGATTFTGFVPDSAGTVADTIFVQLISGSAEDYLAMRLASSMKDGIMNL